MIIIHEMEKVLLELGLLTGHSNLNEIENIIKNNSEIITPNETEHIERALKKLPSYSEFNAKIIQKIKSQSTPRYGNK